MPVLKYEAVLEGEVPVGLGPLHTQYDGKGNAYTSLFVESAVAKWKLRRGTRAEEGSEQGRRSTRFRSTSTSAISWSAAATRKEPYGKYLVAMNKLSKGRHLTSARRSRSRAS